ncbi:MAG: tetraacyldisaccharide 4'-kinase [Aquificaceae bacterium]
MARIDTLLNPYFWVVGLRNLLYEKRLFSVCKLPATVISVGNLSVGGSGKSSLVRFIAKNLADRFHVCILSRGYKRRTRGTFVVSYRGNVMCGWEEAGDEPYMLAKMLRNVSIVVDEKRCRAGMYAVKELKADVLLLDDGFQHRRIYRDLDLLLLKEKDIREFLMPFGRLREPLSSIKRAHALVLSYQDIKEWSLSFEGKPTFKLYREDWTVFNVEGKPVHDLSNAEFVAFAGLGDNEQFFKALEKLGLKIVKKLSFRDHHSYSGFVLSKDMLYITTLKDMVKLAPHKNLYYLDYSVRVPGLMELVMDVVNGSSII